MTYLPREHVAITIYVPAEEFPFNDFRADDRPERFLDLANVMFAGQTAMSTKTVNLDKENPILARSLRKVETHRKAVARTKENP